VIRKFGHGAPRSSASRVLRLVACTIDEQLVAKARAAGLGTLLIATSFGCTQRRVQQILAAGGAPSAAAGVAFRLGEPYPCTRTHCHMLNYACSSHRRRSTVTRSSRSTSRMAQPQKAKRCGKCKGMTIALEDQVARPIPAKRGMIAGEQALGLRASGRLAQARLRQ